MTGSVSLLTTLLVAVIALCFSSQSVQGENVDAGKLSLFMALHSHQDLAWLQTAESYFEGNAYGCTSCFYSDMTAFLTQHPQYKMLVVEVWFLKRWWEWSPGEERAAFRNLLENGQIEIVNGGMSTNDEACIYHDHLIDQFTLGHQFLLKTFNITPHIGWSVDPFGHSAGHAWLLSKMGYDSLFLGRIHDKDKEARKINGQMEFIWHPFNDQKQQLFTHILFNNYFEAPIWNNQQFCKYLLCNEQITNETMSAFLDFLTERKKASLTDNVFYAIGDDFAFSFSGEKDLNNVTIFMEKIKPSLKEFKFSGLGDYLKRVHESFIGNKNKGSKGQDLSTFTEDFFPHTSFEIMSGRLMPWTGFYTTKPVLKGLAYEAMRYLTSLRTLYAKILLSDSQASLLHRRNVWDQLYPLEEALAIISHHDGITGTSRAVVDDEDFYGRTIKAKKKVEEVYKVLVYEYLIIYKDFPGASRKIFSSRKIKRTNGHFRDIRMEK